MQARLTSKGQLSLPFAERASVGLLASKKPLRSCHPHDHP